MIHRNRGRYPRRRRDRVYFPPGQHMENRRVRLRGYAGFSFGEDEERVPRYAEHEYRRRESLNDRPVRRERQDRRRQYGVRDDASERYGRRRLEFDLPDECDDVSDDLPDIDLDSQETDENFERTENDTDCTGDNSSDSEAQGTVLPPYPFPAFAVMPGYPPPYAGVVYQLPEPFAGVMTEEEYREILEFEEYEDRYGRDFDRYMGDEETEAKDLQESGEEDADEYPEPLEDDFDD